MLSCSINHNLTSYQVQLEMITLHLSVNIYSWILSIHNICPEFFQIYFGGEKAYILIYSRSLKPHLKSFLNKSKAVIFWENKGQKPRHVEMEKEHEGVKIKAKEKCG